MKTIKSKIILFFLLTQIFVNIASASTHTYDSLNNFFSVQDALTNGKKLNFVVDFSDCSSDYTKNMRHDIVLNFTPSDILYVKNKKISVSTMHFTMNHPLYKKVPIYQFVNYILNPNGNVTVTSSLLSSDTKQLLLTPVIYECSLGSSARITTY